MFTGLINLKGRVVVNNGHQLVIKSSFEALQPGESIAINGVCLTLLAEFNQELSFDLSPETLKVTCLGQLKPGDEVNMERAMTASCRFGGHYVTGHVDTIACLQAINPHEDFVEITIANFAIPAKPFLLPKGSIALDGVSLTINQVIDETIQIMLVPHTLTVTTLGQMHVGQYLNIEFDYFTRTIAHQFKLAQQLPEEAR